MDHQPNPYPCRVNIGFCLIQRQSHAILDAGRFLTFYQLAPLQGPRENLIKSSVFSLLICFISLAYQPLPICHPLPLPCLPGKLPPCPVASKWVILQGRKRGPERSLMGPITSKTTRHLKTPETSCPGPTSKHRSQPLQVR